MVLKKYGNCYVLLKNKQCEIYGGRLWGCRSYPFMFDGDALHISSCPGIGGKISWKDAHGLAFDLIRCNHAEKRESARIRKHYLNSSIPAGTFVAIDEDGSK